MKTVTGCPSGLPALTLDGYLKPNQPPPAAHWDELVASLIYGEATGLALTLPCGQLLVLQYVLLAIHQQSNPDQPGFAGCGGSFSVWRFHTRLNQPARDPYVTADQDNCHTQEIFRFNALSGKMFSSYRGKPYSQHARLCLRSSSLCYRFKTLYQIGTRKIPIVHGYICHFARAVKGVDLKSTAETRVGSSPAGDVEQKYFLFPSLFSTHEMTGTCVCMYTTVYVIMMAFSRPENKS